MPRRIEASERWRALGQGRGSRYIRTSRPCSSFPLTAALISIPSPPPVSLRALSATSPLRSAPAQGSEESDASLLCTERPRADDVRVCKRRRAIPGLND